MSLAANAARMIRRKGEPMTLKRAGEADIALRGKRLIGALEEGGNSAVQQEFRIRIATTEIAASAWAVKAPRRTDRIAVDGRDRTLLDVKPLSDGATVAKLASAGTAPPTFGREYLRASWATTSQQRGTTLSLPWRVPITDVAVTEAGAELTNGTDYRLHGAGVLERLSSGAASRWSSDAIVVEYTAGWLLGIDASAYDGDADPVPADLVARVIDQARMEYLSRALNPALRSESTQDVGSASYNVIGGDAIGSYGLLRSLESVVGRFKKPTVA
jgi:hypothetical protein